VVLGMVAIVVTRVLARQATPWEWDDLVFSLALDTFAPHAQVPHPPFYPGFVFLGRAVRVFVADNHAALTWVSVMASSLVPVFTYFVATGLGLSRRVGLTAAGLLAFFPAVWFHAGVPLSDPAGLAAGLGATALALRACRSHRAALAATVAVGLAVSIRPQSALPAVLALAVSFASLSPRRKLAVAAASVACVGLFYALPIVVAAESLSGVTSWTAYQAGFVLEHDSLAAHRWAVAPMLKRHFLDSWAEPALGIGVLVLSLAGAVYIWREIGKRTLGVVLLIFLPYAVLSWVFLDASTAGRYALVYLPVVALFAACGTLWLDRRLGCVRVPVAASVLILVMTAISARAVLLVHRQPSPPVAAARAIRVAQADRPYRIVHAPSLRMHAHAFFPGAEILVARGIEDLCSIPLDERPTWLYGLDSGHAAVEAWPQATFLRRVGRGRYLETRWQRREEACIEFSEGFFKTERTASGHTFRWMGARGVLRFTASGTDLRLDLEAELPLSSLARPPIIAIHLNGHELRRLTARQPRLHERVTIPEALLRPTPANELTLSSDQTFVPAESGRSTDRRSLAMKLHHISIALAREE